MLSGWQICVERYPALGEQLSVQTWPYDFKGFYGMRNFVLQNEAGERLAWANSLWVYVDLDTGRPHGWTRRNWPDTCWSQSLPWSTRTERLRFHCRGRAEGRA